MARYLKVATTPRQMAFRGELSQRLKDKLIFRPEMVGLAIPTSRLVLIILARLLTRLRQDFVVRLYGLSEGSEWQSLCFYKRLGGLFVKVRR